MRTLCEKLGLKPGMRIWIDEAPPGYDGLMAPWPERVVHDPGGRRLDFIHLFGRWEAELFPRILQAKDLIHADGMIWVSWPKKSARQPADLTEDLIRDFALAHGLVDVKVCAVSDVWSGLKLVYRLTDRDAVRARQS
ncbi:MAG: DUF3052 family protein [Bacteroidia bacterium]|nr:DUF3052 family protein [Bacteroidia bacterium]